MAGATPSKEDVAATLRSKAYVGLLVFLQEVGTVPA